MNREVTVAIDAEACIGCGLCVRVCPKETLAVVDGKARVTGNESLNCGHCAAVCPVQAIRVRALENDAQELATLTVADRWLPHGEADAAELVRLMRSRRSCRNYTDRPVSAEILRDLVKIGAAAPSGSNCQPWTFTLVPNAPSVTALGRALVGFFRRLNATARRPLLRHFLRLVGQPALSDYYRNHHATVERALAEWEQTGKDRLFWGAPAVIVIATVAEASCPAEDALLAAGYIMLAAHAMGLGTCAIGFAVSAMEKDRSIPAGIGIPKSETVRAVLAVGWPDEKYHRLTGRLPLTIRTAGGASG